MDKRQLILSARIEHQDDGHTYIGVFQNGGKVGVLCVDTCFANAILVLLNNSTLKEKEFRKCAGLGDDDTLSPADLEKMHDSNRPFSKIADKI